jgi:TRAP-type C4-dicarboxylate transport system permease large subunit
MAVLIPFIARPSNDRILAGGMRYVNVTMENLEPPLTRSMCLLLLPRVNQNPSRKLSNMLPRSD